MKAYLASFLAVLAFASAAAAQGNFGIWWHGDTEFRNRAAWALSQGSGRGPWTVTVDCESFGAVLHVHSIRFSPTYTTGEMVVRASGRSFRLPAFTEPVAAEPGWSAPLLPAVAKAMMSGSAADISVPSGSMRVGLSGSRRAIGAVLAECGPGRTGPGMFPPPRPDAAFPPGENPTKPAPERDTAKSIPLIPLPQPSAPAGGIPLIVPRTTAPAHETPSIPLIVDRPQDTALPDVLSTTIRDACQPGTAEVADGALFRGDLTGDGQPDHVVNWGKVTCNGVGPAVTRGAGYCGAAMCSADVYVWPALPPDRPTISILHAGISFFPGATVSIRTSSSRIGPVDWIWTGTEFTNP